MTVSEAGGDERLKLIVMVVQRGKADAPVRAAVRAGAQGATIFYGRGQGMRERLGLVGLAVQPEREVILVAIHEGLVDHVLDAMVDAGNLHQLGSGVALVLPIERAVGLVSPADVERTVR